MELTLHFAHRTFYHDAELLGVGQHSRVCTLYVGADCVPNRMALHAHVELHCGLLKVDLCAISAIGILCCVMAGGLDKLDSGVDPYPGVNPIEGLITTIHQLCLSSLGVLSDSHLQLAAAGVGGVTRRLD